MLDSASLVMTALIAIVIILQIVLVVMVSNLKKGKKEEALPERPSSGEQRDFRRPREQDNRFQRRPPQDQRNKPAPVHGQNIDQVERSLRDINLRLKNAEKDQEKERQRIKDTIQSSPQQSRGGRSDGQRQRGERDDHFRRGDRDRGRHGFDRNRGSGGSHGGRDDRSGSKDNFEGRDNRRGQSAPQAAPVMPPASEAPEVVFPVVEKPVEKSLETANPPESGENLQHGRKFAVKRRALSVEENQQGAPETGSASVSDAPTDVVAVSSETPQTQEQKPEAQAPEQNREESAAYASGPISFGR